MRPSGRSSITAALSGCAPAKTARKSGGLGSDIDFNLVGESGGWRSAAASGRRSLDAREQQIDRGRDGGAAAVGVEEPVGPRDARAVRREDDGARRREHVGLAAQL